ncbi:Kynurenine 3-monooxygenase [Apiospora kogelbergensis]|uniref:Kynurenine 3-monooxygenase n=1 Tax=Apiospora kogelbergensis TaxID=1337665 RepID=UPI0031312162
MTKQRYIVVGAGPVGSLAALYAANRGHEVEIYELRSDLRDPSTTPLNFTKSINLALSERGINAMRHAGSKALLDHVMNSVIPMSGRMIHGKRTSGELYEESQQYDIHGRDIFAADRAELNKTLLDILEKMPNVKFNFNHKLTGADFKRRVAWFEVRNPETSADGRPKEVEVSFDFMMGADGAHSSVRYHLMKYIRMDYQQEYIDTLWCEFQIKPKSRRHNQHSALERFAISPNHLHIWPGKQFMFIAIPSEDGSFTCTLFMPSANYATLEADSSKLPSFFDQHFPGVTSLIPPKELIASFEANPHLPLISIKCKPYHFGSAAVILGDAAHAMVPFYGQGMNAGLEDVRTLFALLDKHEATEESNDPRDPAPADPTVQRRAALAEYSANYVEMRASVLSPTYRLRKALEEWLSVYVPRLGWQTKYSRVSFSNERYSHVIARSDHQGRVLTRVLQFAFWTPLVLGLVGFRYWRHPGRPSMVGNVVEYVGGLVRHFRG